MARGSTDPPKTPEELYRQPLTRDSTLEIETLLQQRAAEQKAFEAIVRLCDYLNRWNGVGKLDVTAAEREITAALAVKPDLANAHYALGFVYRTKGEHEEALAAFTKAAELDGTHLRAIAQAGAEHLYLGHPHEALSAVEKVLSLDPCHPASGMFRWIGARALFFDGKYADSIPWLEQSIESWPDLWYSRAYEVSAHALIGNEAKSKQKLDDFVQRFPELDTVARIIKAERTNPNKYPFVVNGRRVFHKGLRAAGMPSGR